MHRTIGITLRDLLQDIHGLLVFALLVRNFCEVFARRVQMRIALQCLSEIRKCLGRLAHAQIRITDLVIGGGVVGIEPEPLLKRRNRFLEMTCLPE